LLLATPVNGASLAAFRFAVGLVMALEAYALCRPNPAAISSGATPLETYYTGSDIKFNFPYEGFEWLPLLPREWIYALVGLQALAGLTMAVGLWHRASTVTVFLTWAYLFLVESTRTYWQSHFYLELLVTFLLIWMPAARKWSIDAWLARGQNLPRTVPYWTLLLLRGQLVIAYFYAGVAKVNADWLLDAVPVRWFLREAHVTDPYQGYLSAAHFELFKGLVHSAGFAYFISYTGLIFDLSAGFLLLIRRTRIFALILMALFHATNHFLIFADIGWFPLLGITTALIFLAPDWPERFWSWLGRPHPARPDWKWFVGGAILFPIVGAALGWKSKAGSTAPEPKERHQIGNRVAPFVVLWLVWQTLLPIRHYFMPGDGRFTYEGLSFSWRLKTDMRRAFGHQVFIKDTKIISDDETGHTRINWNEWHGDKAIYRQVKPGAINWSLLPEIVVLLEPMIGERIVYNPFARSIQTEIEARERVSAIWQEVYGRQPQAVRGTMPLSQVLDWISTGLRGGGQSQEAAAVAALVSRTKQIEQNGLDPREAGKIRSEVAELLNRLYGRDAKGEMTSFLRAMTPFALEGEPPRHFLLIDDRQLFDQSRLRANRLDRNVWKNCQYTAQQGGPLKIYAGGEPLVIYKTDLGAEARDMLLQACIFDSQDHPERPPYIWWNSPKDLTASKFIHVSNQAFYLRRYATRVATLWEKEYGRRPIVNALTSVWFNGRPPQELVDPNVDLASVPVTWFGHNPWIRDLQMPRIPREAVLSGPPF